MDINEKATEKIILWLGAIGAAVPDPFNRALGIGALVLLVYTTLPQYQRALVDKPAISAICLMHGILITPSEVQQTLTFLQKKGAIGPDNRIPHRIHHIIASMA